MKKCIRGICVLVAVGALSACGSSNPSSSILTGQVTAVAVVPAGSATKMGGSIQGSPLGALSTVSTFAGIAGTIGSADLVGTSASFYQPNDVTTDGTNLYVADYRNHTIRQIVIATGQVTTLAGVPAVIGSADSAAGPATFYFPNAITTDGTNLYVTDANYTVRKIVIASKVVTTLAGLAGNPGSVDGVGAAARFNTMNGITTDGNNLYVSDSNNTIRWIDKNTGAVNTLAGYTNSAGAIDGTGLYARFYMPARITCDGPNLYVCDFNNKIVRKIVISTGVVTTIAGTATSSSSVFNQPNGITTDGTNLFVTDSYNNNIFKIVISSGSLTQIAGVKDTSGVGGMKDGAALSALFHTPIGITTDGKSLYVADSQNHTIRKIQ